MSFATLWDRFFWSFMLLVFCGAAWLVILDDSVRYFPGGLLLGLAVGGGYFLIGVRGLRARDRDLERAIAEADRTAAEAREAEGRRA